MTTVLLGLVAAIFVAAVIALVWRRGNRPHDAPKSEASVSLLESTQGEQDERDVLLVPLPQRDGEALVLGSSASIDSLERSGLIERVSPSSSRPLPQVVRQVMAVGGQAANRSANRQIDSGKIVTLSDETVKQLARHGATYDNAGKALGIVKGEKGKFAHVMRIDRAGAKAVTASNAATLAMTAALSQQLGEIQEQLTEIRETLGELVADKDRERLAGAISANRQLEEIAKGIQRRGMMTDADRTDLGELNHPVLTSSVEAEFKFEEMLNGLADRTLSRSQRQEELERLLGKERLEYWLALRVETELAQSRRDVLHLYWEQVRHPDSVQTLAQEVETSIEARQGRMADIGVLLESLADPESRTRFDALRQISKLRLRRQQQTVAGLLAQHGKTFSTQPEGHQRITDAVDKQEVFVLAPGEANDVAPTSRQGSRTTDQA